MGHVQEICRRNALQHSLIVHTDHVRSQGYVADAEQGVAQCIYNVDELYCVARNGHATIFQGTLLLPSEGGKKVV
jgi:hypothetical protein